MESVREPEAFPKDASGLCFSTYCGELDGLEADEGL